MNFFENIPYINNKPGINPPIMINNDINYKINELEAKIKRLEQKITLLENNNSSNILKEPDNSLYMI